MHHCFKLLDFNSYIIPVSKVVVYQRGRRRVVVFKHEGLNSERNGVERMKYIEKLIGEESKG